MIAYSNLHRIALRSNLSGYLEPIKVPKEAYLLESQGITNDSAAVRQLVFWLEYCGGSIAFNAVDGGNEAGNWAFFPADGRGFRF